MSRLVVYHYPPCGTCRQAIKWLEQQGHELDLRNIKETPPSVAQLAEMLGKSGMELKKFWNTSGDAYREHGLKDKLPEMDREAQLALLSSNGMLIKRPIVYNGNKVTVGFKEEMYEQAWREGK